MRAACLRCGEDWRTNRLGIPDPPLACFGLEGHEHRLYVDADDEVGTPLVTWDDAVQRARKV